MGGHVEEWEEEVKVVANTPYKVESAVEKYVKGMIYHLSFRARWIHYLDVSQGVY